MSTSGTRTFQLTNADILVEAFDRCKIRPSALTRHHMTSGRRSLNLELQTWSNRGVNLFQVSFATLNLVAGQETYTAGSAATNIPVSIQSMLDVYYSTIDGGGSGVDIDRIMLPISRTEYAEIPNKGENGIPTVYWLNKQISPELTIWQPAETGAPTNVLKYYYLNRIQDANIQGGENPDVVYRAYDALCAGLALRLGDKFVDNEQLMTRLEKRATQAWIEFADADNEGTSITIEGDFSRYFS